MGVVVHACNHNTQEVDIGGLRGVQGHLLIHKSLSPTWAASNSNKNLKILSLSAYISRCGHNSHILFTHFLLVINCHFIRGWRTKCRKHWLWLPYLHYLHCEIVRECKELSRMTFPHYTTVSPLQNLMYLTSPQEVGLSYLWHYMAPGWAHILVHLVNITMALTFLQFLGILRTRELSCCSSKLVWRLTHTSYINKASHHCKFHYDD